MKPDRPDDTPDPATGRNPLAREAADPAAPTPRRARAPSLAEGVALLEAHLKTLPSSPGVYRMLNAAGDALYVGKARNLKRRVTSYTQTDRLPMRLKRMVAETQSLEVVVTHTEVEALLLESNLVKRMRPRYNVQLRDDKSFPYILVTADHPAPQITKHRGARSRPGEYFGPFASAGAVNRTLTALQRAFLLRSCSDSVYSARTRPCLLYQIKRCSAPCVGRINQADYAELVAEAHDFLSGQSRAVQQRLALAMQGASEALDFETAAKLRDRIRALAQVQAHQDINVEDIDEADVIAAHQAGGQTCIQVFFFRAGSNYGNRAYYPSHDRETALEEVLAAFIGLFYENKTPPRLILLSDKPAEEELLAEALTVSAGRKVELLVPQRGSKRRVIDHALANAREALARRMAENASQRQLLDGVAQALGLDAPPNRIEVYDNSHIQGRHAYGAMIVAGPEGLMKNAYRKFAIVGPKGGRDRPKPSTEPAAPATLHEPSPAFQLESEPTPAEAVAALPAPTGGDDYAMMREVMERRFARALREDPERERGTWPDLVMLDGGQGQLNSALAVFAELGIDDVAIVAIAKGPDRDAGRERFFMPGKPPFSLEPKDPVLYFLQRLRDEAHRFAIGTHRAKRSKQIGHSLLDEVAGIGAKRKKALLLHFGSAQAVARAGLTDLTQVAGINEAVAKKIYDHFHGQ
ncbi:UvrABC system protein C [Hypericibacter terrae]|uniref:UvrABC system protein C n=1 Tax=Hypericibacter terrae TaxID=2602015 RepID=A0A5J6MEA9_9PROT|nr:excinuclease ABC subunit UvrC [Hypericibacter terrae]QEX15699.1 UvrABC system protein C [Hypericibacter terrae]